MIKSLMIFFVSLIACPSWADSLGDLVFTCGHWPTFYELYRKPDNSFTTHVSVQEFVAYSTPWTVASLTLKKEGDKCYISIQENSLKTERFELTTSGSKYTLRYTGPDEPDTCVVDGAFQESLNKCEEPKKGAVSASRSEEFETIDLYKCDYIGLPLQVIATDYSFRIKSGSKNSKVCLARTLCTWSSTPPFGGYTTEFPREFESYVACLPDDSGYCNKTYEDCENDEGLEFIDKSIGERKVENDLGIRKPVEGTR